MSALEKPLTRSHGKKLTISKIGFELVSHVWGKAGEGNAFTMIKHRLDSCLHTKGHAHSDMPVGRTST